MKETEPVQTMPVGRPVRVAMCRTTKELKALLQKVTSAEGSRLDLNPQAGTCKAFINNQVVFMGIAKGQGGPWICSYYNTPEVEWGA